MKTRLKNFSSCLAIILVSLIFFTLPLFINVTKLNAQVTQKFEDNQIGISKESISINIVEEKTIDIKYMTIKNDQIFANVNNIIINKDNSNYILFALLYLIIVTIWTTSLYFRAIQKGVKKAALITGLILNSWTLVRLVKYQIISLDILNRYLWYSFYLFQLSIPLVILWMSWSIDNPKDLIKPPKWWQIIAILSFILFIFVFSNDLHGLVFKLDLSRNDWASNYSYGFGYFIVLVFAMSNIFIAFLIQVKKSIKSPQRKGFFVPFIIFGLFGFYTYKYIVRDPFFYNSDITIVTGFFTMIMFEACIQCGLIPINSNYVELFKQSPVDFKIYNNDKKLVFASNFSQKYSEKSIDQILKPNSQPLLIKDKLVISKVISGGYAVYFEDMTKINDLLNKNIAASQMLTQANARLVNETKLERSFNQIVAKKELRKEFESEIIRNIKDLSDMVNNLQPNLQDIKQLNQVVLLLTFIKRKSNLFFLLKTQEEIDIKILKDYIDELKNISDKTNTKIASIYDIDINLSSIHALLFYELFYVILNVAIKKDCPYLILYFEAINNSVMMRVLPSNNLGMIKLSLNLSNAIASNNGYLKNKRVEDSLGISLVFKIGGNDND